MTYSATGLPAGLWISSSSGLISGTLPSTSAGNYSVTVSVSDGSLSASTSFTWTVNNVLPGCTDPTAFNYNASATIDDGSCIVLSGGCSDSEANNYSGDPLVVLIEKVKI